MIRVTIDIELLNHKEVLEKNKGKAAAAILAGSPLIKQQIEEEVRKQIISTLSHSLRRGLEDNGVKAKLNIK